MDGHSDNVSDVTFLHGDSDHDLVEAVRQKMWGSVRELLEADVDATTRSWAVQEAITHASDGQLLYILPRCIDDQVDKGVREAVRRDMWGTVGELLARNHTTDKTCRWAVEEAAKRAMDEQLVSIIHYCTDDQVDAVFREAVDRRQWQCVLYLLGRGVTDTQKQWAVEEASKQAEDDELCPLLLHCTDDQLDSVVTRLVTQRRWECVLNLLKRGLPDSLFEMILREASQHAADCELLSLLSFCPDSQYDCVLMEIIQRGCWRAVDQLLQRSIDDQRIRSAIEKATEPWDEDEFDTAVRVALKHEAWTFISHALDQQRDISESTCKLIVQNMSENNLENSGVTVAEEDATVNQSTSSLCTEKMQPVSSDHRSLLTSAVLKLAVSKHMWPTVLQLLGGSKCAFAVEEAMKHADDDVLQQILPHCTDDQVESALHVAVSRRLWFAVSELLQRPVSEIKREWAVEEARTNADDSHLEAILPHCTDDQLDSSLMAAVTRGLWDCGESLMSRRRDLFQRGRLEVDGKHMSDEHVLRLLNTVTVDRGRECDKLFTVLLEAVTRQLWDGILKMTRILPLQQRKWVVVEASKLAHGKILQQLITNYATNISDALGPVLQNLISRDLWSIACFTTSISGFHIRRRCLSHTDTVLTSTQQLRILEEASKRASGGDLEFIVSRLCTRDCVGVVFPHLLERRQWWALSIILDFLTPTQAKQVLQEVGEHADEPTLKLFLDCCPDELFDYAFTLAVKRGYWNSVTHYMQLWQGFRLSVFSSMSMSMSMRHRPSEKVRKLAVEEAMKRATGITLTSILCSCADDQLEVAVREAVKRRYWHCVVTLFVRGLTDELQEWVLEKVIKYLINDEVLLIAPHCADCVSDFILTELVTRRLWSGVLDLLTGTTTPSKQSWAISEASKYAPEFDLLRLIAYSTNDQLDSILTETVKRRMWTCVSKVLKRDVSCAHRKWALEEASKEAPEHYIMSLLQHVDDNDHCILLTETVRRRMWRCVGEILQRGVDVAQQEWALAEASKHASETQLLPLLQYVTDAQLCPILTTAVGKRMWRCVGEILERGVEITQQEWALAEASKHASETELLPLLKYVTDAQVCPVLITAVGKHMWSCVAELLKRGIDAEHRKWAVEEASKHASEERLLALLPHCPDDELDTVFKETAKRRQWRVVKKLLDGPREGRRRVSLQETTQEMKLNYDKELRNVMQENDWTTVSFMLECFTVSGSARRQAVYKVCKIAHYHVDHALCKDNDFISIIQHCDHTQLMAVLQAAVERNLPHTACDILTRLGQHGEPGALTKNGRAILLAVTGIKNGRQKLVAECMKLGITTGESEDTNRSRLLGSYNVDILSKDSPFRSAVLDNNIVIARMLYECGVCSNTDIQKLCNDFAAWEVRSELFQATFQNMSMFLKEKTSTPRSLVSMCRLVISRHLGVGCIRQERVKQLPLPEPLRDYVVFANIEGLAADDVTDDDATPDGDVIKAALLDVRTKLASIRTYN